MTQSFLNSSHRIEIYLKDVIRAGFKEKEIIEEKPKETGRRGWVDFMWHIYTTLLWSWAEKYEPEKYEQNKYDCFVLA